MSENGSPDITTLTVQLLSAFVSNNSVPTESLAELIRTTRTALTEDPAANAAASPAATYTPAVSARKSLSSPDHILSMIDGRPYKTLKRHLATHGLTPDEYRQRYDLPKSYPLVAPSYSEARRAVATRLGLGRKPGSAAKPAAPKADAARGTAPVKPVAAKAETAKPVAAKAEPAKPAADKAPATNGTKAPAKAKAKTPAKAKPKLSIRPPKDEQAAAPAAKPRSKPKAPAAPKDPAS
ncbi:Ros/MucR family transcriptional regulator [Sphingobium mellinum]|uniref:MucR family transcriptional regulator n=1 Tax=Sphingobium mellinum TaxID=1387166 RepID=UPI0030EB63F7